MFSPALYKLAILATIAIFGIVVADDDDDDKGNPCWKIPERQRTWEFIPCEGAINNADPVARVFKSRLYVYTSWDDKKACGKRQTSKKQGTAPEVGGFCMQGTIYDSFIYITFTHI